MGRPRTVPAERLPRALGACPRAGRNRLNAMKSANLRTVLHLMLVAAFAPGLRAAPAAPEKPAALLETYCQDCHNSTDWAGSLALDVMDLEQIPADAKVWEAVVRKLRGRLMPPPTEKQPPQANIDQFVTFLESRIDEHATATPAPGL